MTAPRAKSNEGEFRRRLSEFGKIFGSELDTGLRNLGSRWDAAMQRRMREGTHRARGTRKPAGQATGRGTGALARSLVRSIKGEGARVQGKELRFGSRMPGQKNYARIQEEGGEIVPRRRKFLAVPLPDAYAGRTEPDPPRSYPDTFVLATQKGGRFGGLFIVQDAGGGKFKFLFALRKKVKLEPRLGMVDTMRVVLEQHRGDEIRDALDRSARRAFA